MQKASQKRLSVLLQGVNEHGKQDNGITNSSCINFSCLVNEHGKQDNGITRLAYSKEEKEASLWLLKEIQDLNVTVSEDAIGNIFIRRDGTDLSLPAVAMGSHLDSVAEGGMYDGVVGVISAIEVLYMLKDENLKHSLEVIIFKAEESSRFGVSNIGSKLLTGTKALPDLITSRTNENILLEAMSKANFAPENFLEVVKEKGYYKAFFEVHIEQGKILETENKRIGIVDKVAGPTRFTITLEGAADHAGATAMEGRRDALVAAAKVVLAVQEAAIEESIYGTVATVGNLEIFPGAINVIPGKVVLWIDLRGTDEESIARTYRAIKMAAATVSFDDEVKASLEMLSEDKPVALSEDVRNVLSALCEKDKIEYKVMTSRAGHDAMYMAGICKTGLIFIPCKDGISHSSKEYAKIEDIATGAELLAQAVLHYAK